MSGVAHTLLGGAVLAGLLGLAPYARQETKPPGCGGAAHRQFDFWQGEWDVFDRHGARVGRNRIEVVLGGCALVEHWEGAAGGSGTSLNAWSAADGQWRQMWVDGSGSQLDLRGTWDAATRTMTLSGAGRGRDGEPIVHEISWQHLPDDSVRQRWRQSRDTGQTWRVVFDGHYRRGQARCPGTSAKDARAGGRWRVPSRSVLVSSPASSRARCSR